MFKKVDTCTTVAEVIERNTGIPAENFIKGMDTPYIKNLREAVNLLLEHRNEKIHIIGDYDSDGINATAIMKIGLERYGIHARVRLPLRFTEGYGLSKKIIDEIDQGVVITVDNGIAAIDAIKAAKKKGLTVIVTDHHQAPVDEKGNCIFPEADIIVDPSTETESEYHDYCGAAIAYRFVKELLPQEDLTDLMVLASIATVTDVMSLTGANHTLVRNGLYAINHGAGVPGLRMLLEKLDKKEHIDEGDYGFLIGPIFNAAGRLYDNGASKMLELLLMDKNNVQLPWKADQLIKINNRRKDILKKSLDVADALLTDERPIVLYHPEFGEGIIGLIAGRYCEAYQCPVVVFTKTKNGILKGSGRSVPGVNLKKVLDQIQSKMLGYGGHAGAAGFSIEENQLESFKRAFREACGELPKPEACSYYDLEIKNEKQLRTFIAEQKIFAPYGEGNPKIRVLYQNFCIDEYRKIGDGSHMMLKGEPFTAMGFGMSEAYEKIGFPKRINGIGYLGESWFRGQRSYKFELNQFRKGDLK